MRAKSPSKLVFVLAIMMHVAGGGICATADNGTASESATVRIPIHDGRVEVAQITAALAGTVGFDGHASAVSRLESLDWTINTRSCFGRCQMAALETLSACSLALSVDGSELVISEASGAWTRLTSVVRGETHGIMRRIPERRRGPPPSFGVAFLPGFNSASDDQWVASRAKRLVVLVHGLDDPGWIFDDLVPVLQDRGYAVAMFEYPNDGPIEGAADLFADSLRELRAQGVTRVDVVAHSMGGLVARDLLTRSDHYDGDGAGTDELPAIDRLIMVGTPIHGSHFARLRALGEIREQVVRAIQGDQPFRRADEDGSGEAAKDLLPNSDFLKRLNNRPLATHTRHTIIAARLSPIEAEDLNRWTRELRKHGQDRDTPRWLRNFLNETIGEDLPRLLENAVDSIGDGVVTIESARLDGVSDFTVVDANHMTMLSRPGDDHDVPPSIPIILDRLDKPQHEG